MRKRVSYGFAVAAVFSMAQLATAQSTPPAGGQGAQGTSTQERQGAATGTVTGTVVSSSATQLVIETPSGRQTFTVDASSTLPRDLAAGTRVTVDFNRADDGMTVTRVRATGSGAGTTATTGTTGSTSRDTTSGTTGSTSGTTGMQERDPAGTKATDRDRTGGADRDRDRDVLPDTASPMAAIGLLGLASLAGYVTLRMRRRVS
jgi:hypothetical protein